MGGGLVLDITPGIGAEQQPQRRLFLVGDPDDRLGRFCRIAGFVALVAGDGSPKGGEGARLLSEGTDHEHPDSSSAR